MTDTEFASSPGFFEAKYQSATDPWRFATDPYEQQRYKALTAAIDHRRYRHAFEPGCSIGVFTERLAGLCDLVEAIDFSPTASALTRVRCADLSNVRVQCAALPQANPSVGYDLLVLSEIGYYFELDRWAALSAALVNVMPLGGTVLAAHWLGDSTHHRLTGDQVHDALHRNPNLRAELSQRTSVLRLERFLRI